MNYISQSCSLRFSYAFGRHLLTSKIKGSKMQGVANWELTAYWSRGKSKTTKLYMELQMTVKVIIFYSNLFARLHSQKGQTWRPKKYAEIPVPTLGQFSCHLRPVAPRTARNWKGTFERTNKQSHPLNLTHGTSFKKHHLTAQDFCSIKLG